MSDHEEKKRAQESDEEAEGVSFKRHTIDFLVANIIPTTKYFESRFDFLQHQINELRQGQKDLEDRMNLRFEQVHGEIKEFKETVDKRFEQVDKRFDQVDKRFEQIDKRFEQIERRFEQVDKRFEQVDKRFEQMIASIDRLSEKLDRRDADQRNFTLRMFTIAISISFLGVLGVLLKLVGVL